MAQDSFDNLHSPKTRLALTYGRDVRFLILEHALIAAIIGLNPFPNLFTVSLALVGLLALKLMRAIGARWGFPPVRDVLAIAGNFFGGLGALALAAMAWLTMIAAGIYFSTLRSYALAASYFTFVWVIGQATQQFYEASQVRLPKAETTQKAETTHLSGATNLQPATLTHQTQAIQDVQRFTSVKRRQFVLSGLASALTMTGIHDYMKARQLSAQQTRLARVLRESPEYVESYLQAAFSSDAKLSTQTKEIQESLKIAVPTAAYDRTISKLLIRCSRLGTEQYLTGTIVENYDGSIKRLPSYDSQLDSYTQFASIIGPEEATTSRRIDLRQDTLLPSDPLRDNLDWLEEQVQGLAGQAVVVKWLSPVYWGFVLTNSSHSIMMFRGTQRTNEWIQNFLARQDVATPISRFKFAGKVHSGFATLYASIAQTTIDIAAKLDPSRPVYITGHSLGAALATLAAMDIALRVPQIREQVRLYTYASPRIGNLEFANEHSRLVPNSYRVVNVADAIPLAPPTFIKNLVFVHVGQQWSFVDYTGDVGPSHFVSSYRQAIDRELETNTLS